MAENVQYGVQLKRTRKAKTDDGEEAPSKSEVKITFLVLPAMEIDLSQQPPGEDWSIWAGKDGTPYDPLQPVECEVLDCLLKYGLPADGIAAPSPPKRKRKSAEESSEPAEVSRKRRKKATDGGSDVDNGETAATAERPKKRGKAHNTAPDEGGEGQDMTTANSSNAAAEPKRAKKAKKWTSGTSAPIEKATTHPPPVFRLPSADFSWLSQKLASSQKGPASVVDLCAGDESDEEVAGTANNEAAQHGSLFVSPARPAKPPSMPPASVRPSAHDSAGKMEINEAAQNGSLFLTPARPEQPPRMSPAGVRPFAHDSAGKVDITGPRPEDSLTPGEVIAPNALRELRAASTLLRSSSALPVSLVERTPRTSSTVVTQSKPPAHEVIHLT